MNLAPVAVQQFFGNDGNPLSGGLLFTYISGTNTKLATYSNAAGTPNTNPIVLDFRGQARIWLDQTLTYRFILAPANDTDPPTNPIWSVDDITAALTYASLTAIIIGTLLYPISSAEQAAGLTNNDLNRIFPYGNLSRFKVDLTGSTDNSTQIANAIAAAVASGGIGYVFHPGGSILHASQITVPNGVTIYGNDRSACEFVYSGVGSGWRNFNAGPSGYGKVRFENVKLTATNTANAGAAIELNTGGFAYYQIVDCWLFNRWKYGVILDGAEVVVISRNLIDLAGPTVGGTAAGVWIVNGPDRTVGQAPGFTNIVTIRDNMVSLTGGTGVIDDGGNGHLIEGNNFNEHSLAMRICGTTSLTVLGNSFESHKATSSATMQFTNLTSGGVNVGQALNTVIKGNGFYTDQASGNVLIFISQTYTITNITQAAKAVVTVSTVSAVNPFVIAQQFGLPVTFNAVVGMTQINGLAGFIDPGTPLGGVSGAWTATIQINSTAFTAYASGGNLSHYHTGVNCTENIFGWTAGRAAAIDVSQLANSFCGHNFDLAQSVGMAHYTGAHSDQSGNTLWPPENGYLGTVGVVGPTYGDTRFPMVYKQGRVEQRITITYSAAMSIDLNIGTQFQITATNGTAFTINNPTNSNIGQIFTVTIRNTSGGALGVATWNPSYKLAAWVQPGNGFSRSITYQVDTNGNSVEVSRTAADVAN